MRNLEICHISEYQNNLHERLQAEALAIRGIYAATARFKNSSARDIAVRFPVMVQDISASPQGKTFIEAICLNSDFRQIGHEARTPIEDGIMLFDTEKMCFPLQRVSTGKSEYLDVQATYLRNAVDPLDNELKAISYSLDLTV